MDNKNFPNRKWDGSRIAITGANGRLGKTLTKELRDKGAWVIGITHGSISDKKISIDSPHEWISWQCGKEEYLEKTLQKVDILILNHGINPKGQQSISSLNQALEINALSTWRIIELFENIALRNSPKSKRKELWVNTSEAEIQPALSPGYEISKRLIGELVSIRWNNLNKNEKQLLLIRKIILGPFKSDLNPIGIMNAEFVARNTIWQASIGLNLIIVSPNPITYISMPITELTRYFYHKATKLFNSN